MNEQQRKKLHEQYGGESGYRAEMARRAKGNRGNSKLSEEAIKDIMSYELSRDELSKKYSISVSQISRIRHGKSRG